MSRSIYWLFVVCLVVGLGACDCGDDTIGVDLDDDAGIGDDAGDDPDADGDPDADDDLDATGDPDTGGDPDATGDPDADDDPFEDDACGLYQAECDGECIPVSMDPDNCGGCGITCGEGEVCTGGQCVDEGDCPGGLTACDGICTDTIYDSDHCGLCGNVCGEGQGCAGGQCVDQIELGDDPEFCEGGGPVIEFGENVESPQSCAGDLAESTFRWGLCGCDGVFTGDPVAIDAYDSSIGPYTPGGPGGGLGTNAKFIGDSALSVTGTLWARGDELMSVDGEYASVGVYLDDPLTVGQRLYTNYDLQVNESVSIGDDTYIGGDVNASGTVNIDGDLYVQPSSSINATVNADNTHVQSFEVGSACAYCAPDDAIDVEAIVDAYSGSANDNALIGLDSSVLSGSSGNIRLELPCGHYYLDEINTDGPTTIVATGHTALYIGGDIAANNELTITLAPDARFDVFVAGSFETNNPFRLGSPNYPGLMRMYIGGEGGFVTNNEIEVGGFIYAVPGGIVTNNEIEIFGGLHGQYFNSNNEVEIHYDRRITTVGRECPDPDDDPDDPDDPDAGGDEDAGPEPDADNGDDPDPPMCSSSGESCAIDTDCCAPLTCQDGQCGLLDCQAAFEPCTENEQCCTGVCSGSTDHEGVCIVN